MAVGAKVGSFDALRAFRTALFKFAETADVALADAEGEMMRVQGWLERDQQSYWQFQMRKRHEDVVRAKEAVRMKKLFKGADGRQGSAVDEEKALTAALKRLARGEEKCKLVMSHTRKFPKEILLYKGNAQRLSTALQSEVPTAGAQLSRIIATLEAYAALTGPAGGGGGDSGRLVSSAIGSELTMSRGGADAAGARSQWAHLRSRTPAGDARNTASSVPVAAEIRSAVLAGSELESLLKVSSDRDSADPQGKVIVATDLAAASRIYLERLDVAFPGDSGWYIGRADDAAPAAGGALTVAEVLAVRPDLAEVLTLPKGFLVVLDGGGVVAVLGPRDEDLWKTADQAAESTSGSATTAAAQAAADAVPTASEGDGKVLVPSAATTPGQGGG